MIQADWAEPTKPRRNEKEKRKKRKQKKKKQSPQNEPSTNQDQNISNDTNGHTDLSLIKPPNGVPSGLISDKKPPMSPRKQTLLRHQETHDQAREPSFISEAKQFKKNRKTVPADTSSKTKEQGQNDYSSVLPKQTFESKVSLFKHLPSKIVVYHDHPSSKVSNALSSTLLGHGELEVFQLHNGDVTYLACGPSFVYPLLPKQKILRTGFNQFVLPLVNPERFWEITLDTKDQSVLNSLQAVLKEVVRYTNMHFSSSDKLQGLQDQSPDDRRKIFNQFKHDQQRYSNGAVAADPVSQATKWDPSSFLAQTYTGHAERLPLKEDQFTPYFNTIPESPPSAPASPQLLFEDLDHLNLNSSMQQDWDTKRTDENQSITSALASFNFNYNMNQGYASNTVPRLNHPTPVNHASQHINPHYKQVNPYLLHAKKLSKDNKSDQSSMDSLLDEYEENISTTKSLNYNASRPQSRAMSLASSAQQSAIQYQRGHFPIVPDNVSNMESVNNEANEAEDDDEEEVFKTSLSRYNRHHQSQSQRSRKSSRSELYTSVSNWMEPNVQPRALLGHSRSNHSLASARNSVHSTRSLANNLREIYRSVTERNLQGIVLKEVSRRPSIESLRSELKSKSQNSTSLRNGPQQLNKNVSNYGAKISAARGQNKKKDSLTSTDVYNLVSARSGARDLKSEVSRPSGISRFFGW